MAGRPDKKSEVRLAAGALGSVVTTLAIVSGVVNMLALTGSFYMLQVYDRVLSSRSVPTLVALSLLAVGLFLFQGGLEVMRCADPGAAGEPARPAADPAGHERCHAAACLCRRAGQSAAADPRRRCDPHLPVRAGADGDPRHAVDAALSGLRLHPASGAGLDHDVRRAVPDVGDAADRAHDEEAGRGRWRARPSSAGRSPRPPTAMPRSCRPWASAIASRAGSRRSTASTSPPTSG